MTNKSTLKGKPVQKEYKGRADAFIAYSHELNRAYLLPIPVVFQRTMTLRLVPASNGQEAGINYASDYEICPKDDPL